MSSAHELRVDQGDVPAVVSGSACVWTSSLPEKRVFELESSCRPPLRYRLVRRPTLFLRSDRKVYMSRYGTSGRAWRRSANFRRELLKLEGVTDRSLAQVCSAPIDLD